MKAQNIFLIGLAIFLIGATYIDQIPKVELQPKELACLEKMIYQNECSGRASNLISWRKDEAFPSLGIGHFIWYPQGDEGPYQESFPGFLLFAAKHDAAVPAWINNLPALACPWSNREEFQKDKRSEKMTALRDFLDQTRELQASYIVQRMETAFSRILEKAPEDQRSLVREKLFLMIQNSRGMFALIDYVNFKGEGTLESERFNAKGWGLLQVLEEMKMPSDPSSDILPEFVRAAQAVLEQRVRNSPAPEIDQQRLKGWKKRVKRYLDIAC